MFKEPVGFKSNSRIKAVITGINQYPFHMHMSVIEIIWVLQGEVMIYDSLIKHHLKQGDIYMFNPKDPHKICSTDDENMVLITHIDVNYYKKFFSKLPITYFVCRSFEDGNDEGIFNETKYLKLLLSKIYFQCVERNGSDMALEELGNELIGVLMDQFSLYTYVREEGNRFEIVRVRKNNSNSEASDRIYNIIDYIYDNFRGKVRLEDICGREYLSKSYLSRYIKKISGLSFCEILSIARCEEAERLLFSTTMSIEEIAVFVGFANRKHLNVQFEKWFMMSPAKYRKKIISNEFSGDMLRLNSVDLERAQHILEGYMS